MWRGTSGYCRNANPSKVGQFPIDPLSKAIKTKDLLLLRNPLRLVLVKSAAEKERTCYKSLKREKRMHVCEENKRYAIFS